MLQEITKLKQKKYRDEFCEFVVEGVKGVAEALGSDTKINSVIIGEDDKNKFAYIINKISSREIPVFYASKIETDKIKNTDTFPGIAAVIMKPDFNIEDLINKKPIIVLDKINDPGNLGTIIRTADWFGLDNILISEESVDVFNDKVVRSTMGSLFHLKFAESTNIVQDLEDFKQKGYNIILLDMNGKDIKGLKPNKKSIYVFGSESHGIRPEIRSLADNVYSIKGGEKTESLNVAVSAGIVMSHL